MDTMKRFDVEREEEWMKWVKKIPFINFDSDWDVQPIPAFGGAMVRFRVQCGDLILSVYLDCYDRLGCYGEPYWEVYPHNSDIIRIAMGNTEALLEAIRESFKNGESLN